MGVFISLITVVCTLWPSRSHSLVSGPLLVSHWTNFGYKSHNYEPCKQLKKVPMLQKGEFQSKAPGQHTTKWQQSQQRQTCCQRNLFRMSSWLCVMASLPSWTSQTSSGTGLPDPGNEVLGRRRNQLNVGRTKICSSRKLVYLCIDPDIKQRGVDPLLPHPVSDCSSAEKYRVIFLIRIFKHLPLELAVIIVILTSHCRCQAWRQCSRNPRGLEPPAHSGPMCTTDLTPPCRKHFITDCQGIICLYIKCRKLVFCQPWG